MKVQHFFHKKTSTLTYVVWDESTRDAVVIDPVLDFDDAAVSFSETALDEVESFVQEQGLRVHWVVDTHAHADHVTGASALAARLGAKTAMGSRITEVQAFFAPAFGLEDEVKPDGSQWDALVPHQGALEAGSLRFVALHTPGHTPACTTWKVNDAVFTGDAMFMPDFGTGRCDFPHGSASDLYDSIQTQLYSLPDGTRVFVGHDYQPGGRELEFETTIGACKSSNKQLKAGTPRQDFVDWRSARDAQLSPPRLLFQSIQLNITGGRLPAVDATGRRFLRIPIGLLD